MRVAGNLTPFLMPLRDPSPDSNRDQKRLRVNGERLFRPTPGSGVGGLKGSYIATFPKSTRSFETFADSTECSPAMFQRQAPQPEKNLSGDEKCKKSKIGFKAKSPSNASVRRRRSPPGYFT